MRGLRIRRETPEDYREAEYITREAFWNVYKPACDEHYILHMFRNRADYIPELAFVMEMDGRLVGHIMYVRAHIHTDDGRGIPIMSFGPVSILPLYQRKGYGKALVDYSMEQAAALGCGAICITGNHAFYGKSGFEIANDRGVYLAGMPREVVAGFFLVKELKPGYLDGITGVYTEFEGYVADPKAVEAFDVQFPPKIRQKLPGQLV